MQTFYGPGKALASCPADDFQLPEAAVVSSGSAQVCGGYGGQDVRAGAGGTFYRVGPKKSARSVSASAAIRGYSGVRSPAGTGASAAGLAAVQCAAELRRLARSQEAGTGARAGAEPLLAKIAAGAAELRPHTLANTVWSLARLFWSIPPLVDIVCGAALEQQEALAMTDVSKAMWSMARLLYAPDPAFNAFANLAVGACAAATVQEVASVSWALAKLRESHMPLWDALSTQALLKLHEFQTQSCTNVLWSAARLPEPPDGQLCSGFCSLACELVGEFNRQDLTNTAWALAMLRRCDDALLEAIAGRSVDIIRTFQWQDLANSYWAFAKLQVMHTPFLCEVSEVARMRMANADPQNISNLAWSLAALKIEDGALMDCLSSSALAMMNQFEMQEVSNTVWALAHLQRSDVPLLKALSIRASTCHRAGNVQNLTNTAWAFATLRFRGTTMLFHALAREAIATVEQFREQDVSIVAWAYGRMEVRDAELLDALAAQALRKIDGFDGRPQQISNLAWAAAVLDFRSLPLMDGLAHAAVLTSAEHFSPQELANVLWAYASLRLANAPLLHAFAPTVAWAARAEVPGNRASCAWAEEASTQNLVNVTWAVELLRQSHDSNLDSPLLGSSLTRFLRQCESSLGVEWTTLAGLVEAAGATACCDDFMQSYRSRILKPTLNALRALRVASDERSVEEALQRLQDWVEAVQLPHFGGVASTCEALEAAGSRPLPDGGLVVGSWGQRARQEVSRAAWWSCPRAAVSSQGVVAWVAAELRTRGSDAGIREAGKLFFADDSAEQAIFIERSIRPLYLQVPRGGHAERRALLAILRAAMSLGDLTHIEGHVLLYASHYPCISCLAAIAQFARRLPGVTLSVDFDNAWLAWQERPLSAQLNAELVVGVAR